jgi:Transglycosylase SLT domain
VGDAESGPIRLSKALSVATILLLLPTAELAAQPVPPPRDTRLAQLTAPAGKGADWQQWDGFLTTVVKKLADDLPASRRDQLGELFLDSRYQLTQALSLGTSDPVPGLFLDTWSRLGPLLNQAGSGLSPGVAAQYKSFVTTMDTAASLTTMGQRFGLVQITPDMLRGASTLLGTGSADPLAYVLDVDQRLRALLGFTGDLPTPRPSPVLGFRRAPWFVASAFAADEEFDRLNGWVPQAPEVSGYLLEVRKLLTQSSAAALGKYRLAPQYQTLFRQIVFSAAWQESCWRQFVRKGETLTPLASTTGDVGMMQVNRQTWRGLYDVNGLSGDIGYNSHAGSEILLYYLARHAIPKGEDKQPGGNLARATYSAYNGGPRALNRYRNAATPPAWKKVDEAFWAKFRTVSAGQELAVRSCFGK